ncbi:TPA: hypothetical protein AB5F35_003627, partial [Vibrio cholerae]
VYAHGDELTCRLPTTPSSLGIPVLLEAAALLATFVFRSASCEPTSANKKPLVSLSGFID